MTPESPYTHRPRMHRNKLCLGGATLDAASVAAGAQEPGTVHAPLLTKNVSPLFMSLFAFPRALPFQ